MTSKLSPLDIQRLAYSRFLYDEGVGYALRPAPLSSTAVLSFHDAVENFLGLAAEFLGMEVSPKISFVEYWGVLRPAVLLPAKGSMITLNGVRVALKHHGVFPSSDTVEKCRANVLNFFTTATPMVFGVEFDSINMIGLVTQPDTAQLLRDAQTHADVGDWVQAMAGLRLAMEALLERYARPRELTRIDSPFAFGPRIDGHQLRSLQSGTNPERELAKAVETAVATQRAIQVISLGIDFSSYIRFTWLTPSVNGYMAGPPRYYPTAQEEAVTDQDYAWALNFVIESAFQASRADEVLELVNSRVTSNWDAQFSREPRVMRSWDGPARVQPSSGSGETDAGGSTDTDEREVTAE
ncbi:hypothetical protein [Streptomyces sp. NPDC001903]|uniref:hypothetical protein n=1 Tax=Streptomyces sp. NPDC001903 TaxID=3364622 RepID=UPI0036AC43CB